MKPKSLKTIPVLIALGVVALLLVLKSVLSLFPRLDFIEQLERMTYDWRAALYQKSEAAIPPDYLGAVFVDDDSLQQLNQVENGGFQYPLPRFVYGQLIEELTAQGAESIALDIFFLDRNFERDHLLVPVGNASNALPSDAYFAKQMGKSRNVILAAPPGEVTEQGMSMVLPTDLFATNAAEIGFTHLVIDPDGVRRKCRAFIDDPTLKRRFWHVGILVAARHLKLDLDQARMRGNNLVLARPGGTQRVIPLDENGCFYIRWAAPIDALSPDQQSNLFLVRQAHLARQEGQGIRPQFQDKLVVVGAAGAGNNVGDRGPTPLESETVLCSSIWNIAASVVEGKFIRQSGPATNLGILLAMALGAAVLAVRLRALWASVAVLGAAAGYTALSVWLFLNYLLWLPVALPIGGALLMTFACFVSYRLVIELVERRRVRFVHETFGGRFPSDVVDLLAAQDPPEEVVNFLGLPPSVVRMLAHPNAVAERKGVRRQVTVFFADIRNFTEFMDTRQVAAESFVQQHRLPTDEADRYLDAAVRDLLTTVNVYLSTIAEIVRTHNGTLDKYVGDAVMAFWGAPHVDPQHAVGAVRAALAGQHAVALLNKQRAAENKQREHAHSSIGGPASQVLLPLPILGVGMALNSGDAIAGFMGSPSLVSNYTVFGKEVNIASRLEALADSGRIVISESTYRDLKKFAPDLASLCVPREPVILRGIRKPIQVYDVNAPS